MIPAQFIRIPRNPEVREVPDDSAGGGGSGSDDALASRHARGPGACAASRRDAARAAGLALTRSERHGHLSLNVPAVGLGQAKYPPICTIGGSSSDRPATAHIGVFWIQPVTPSGSACWPPLRAFTRVGAGGGSFRRRHGLR